MTTNTDNNPAAAYPASAERETEPRTEPPLVYRAANTQDHWVVEPPREAMLAEATKVFTGSRAQYVALMYAYETFGNARFLPY